jgi:hypothetical protein
MRKPGRRSVTGMRRFRRTVDPPRVSNVRCGIATPTWTFFGVGGGTGNNALRPFDASPAWGSPHVGTRIEDNPVREVGITDLWLPAA